MAKENSAGGVGAANEGQTGLTFSSADIKGMEASGNSLVITLKDGSTYTIENFRDLADNNVQLTMQDGKTLDTHALYQNLSGDALPVVIGQPEAGLKSEYQLEAGQKYKFNFAPGTNETVNEADGALILTFEDGGVLVLKNFNEAMDSETPAEVSYDGEFMSLREFLDTLKLADAVIDAMEKADEKKEETVDSDIREESAEELALNELAEQLAEVEPAAGDGGGGGRAGGFGFQSNFAYTPVIPLDDVGPIGPTALRFGLPEFSDELFFQPMLAQAPTPPAPPELEVSNALVYEDGSVTLTIFADPNGGPSVRVAITVSGIPSDWGVVPNGGVYNAGTGTWSIMVPPGQQFSGGPTLFPPADSDADIPSLTVTATNRSTVTGLNSQPTVDHISVTTDAVADTPDVAGSDSTVNEDTPAPIDVSAAVADMDGSEHITAVYIKQVPPGFTLSAGADMGGGVWMLTPGQLPGLTISAPANFFGSIDLEVVGVATEDNKSGADFDTTNDQAESNDFFTVTWKPVADTPSIEVNLGADEVKVKEDGTVDVDIKAALNPVDSPDAVLTVTVTGIDPAWGFSAPVGVYDASMGTWTVTMVPGANLATVMTFTPPADSDIDLSGLNATATAFEPATGTSASTDDAFFITVDSVADAPTLDAANAAVDEGNPIAVDLTAALTDLDGSELITGYEIGGVPAGFTFSAGTDMGGGVWAFTPGEIAGLTLTPNDPDFYGTLNLTAKVLNTENPVSDGEYDTADNNNEAIDAFTLTWKPVADTPEILVNGGVPDAQVKEDGSVNIPIEAKLNAKDSPDAVLTVTVTGIDPSWGFSAPVGVYNAGMGTWTVTMAPGANLATVMTFTPPADSDIDLSGLNATATAFEPATGTSASADDGFGIIVDAVADAPTLDAQNAGGLELSTIPLTINTALTDTDGSEMIKLIRISNVPAGFTLTAGTEVSAGTWELQLSDLTGLGINVPNGTEGNYTLNVESVSTEDPVTDGEYDPSDNDASAFDTITLCIEDNARPELGGAEETVDETFLAPIVEHGSVAASFGTDGPGVVAGNGAFTAGGSLMGGSLNHNGVAVNVTYDTASGTYTGMAGAVKIFTLQVNAGGTYTFQQFENLDHGNPNDPNDVIQLNFGVKATDTDGDVATSTIVINVLDDAPDANNDNNAFDLMDGGTDGNVISGVNGGPGANDDVGEDNPATVTSVTFNGTTYTVPANGSVTINGDNGTLVMHSNGEYSYTLKPCPPPNSPPVALDDCYTLLELDAKAWNGTPGGTTLTHGSSKKYLTDGATVYQDTGSDSKGFWYKLPVLKNDSDPDGDPITITKVVHHSGSMEDKEFKLSSDGKYILVRIGQDGDTKDSSFKLKYTITDGKGGTDDAIVTVKIKDFNSPLVMDLDGDGIELLPIEAGVTFDMGPNGELDNTGWAGADDGFLAIDLNSDGAINDHGELFGTGTTDGFTVLSNYDTNGDNVIDALDAQFGDLIVWRDANSDGVSQAGEMHSLDSLGITSINVAANLVDYMLEGSMITHESTFTMNGDTRMIVDAWFETMAVDVPAGPSVPPSGGSLVVDQFTYTLTDTDGDSDQALLTLTADIPPPPQITLTVNGGVPDVHVKEDGSVNVAVDLSITGGSSTMTTFLVVSGISPSWGFTPPAGWTPTAIPGNYSITLAPGATAYNGSFTFTPPANSDIDLGNLRVTANTTSYGTGTALLDCGCNGQTTAYSDTETDNFNIIVDAVADTPSINVNDITGDHNTNVGINITAALTDLDGSELISGYQISGVPAGFTFNAGTNTGGGVWTFTPAEIAGLKIKAPAGFEGSVNLTATVFNTENPVSDGEFDPSDNNNQASDTFSFTVVCDEQPTVVSATELLDETNLSGGALTETGSISPNYFGDGPGVAAGTGSFSSNGSKLAGNLTSGGVAVNVVYSAATGTYTGTAGAATVFTLKMNGNGTYEFKLFEQLDHADGSNPNDAINLVFGVKATDADGDIATGTVTVTVKDDAPFAHNDVNDGSASAPGTATGNVITGLNGGPGAADTVGQDIAGKITVISFGGTDYPVPASGTVTVPGANGDLTIAADGSYTYTLHAGAGTSTSVNHFGETLVFPTGGLSDGSAISGSELNNLGIKAGEMTTAGAATGSVKFVSEGAGYNNTLGMYTIAADGTLQAATVLIQNGNAATAGQNFNFTAGAGETIAFFIVADGFSANGGYAGIDLNNGTLNFVYKYGTAQERPANITDDGADVKLVYTNGTTHAETVLSGPVYHTTERGNPGNLNADDSVRVLSGLANGSDDTSLRISFEDLPNLGDHDFEDIIFDVKFSETTNCGCVGDQFTYTLADRDGDTSTATLTVEAECLPPDDQPVLLNAEKMVDETGLSSGTIMQNGAISVDYGNDGPGATTGNGAFSAAGSLLGGNLTSHGVAVNVTYNAGTGLYTGMAGAVTVFTLKIDAANAYEFKQFEQLDHADGSNANDIINLVFGVKATDTDGDVGEGTVTIQVKDDAPDAVNDGRATAGNATITGNVTANDNVGQDTDGKVTKVQFGSTVYNVPSSGNLVIDAAHGVLTIDATGAYSYAAKNHASGTDNFTYTLRDYDGDTDTACLEIAVECVPVNNPPDAVNDCYTVYELDAKQWNGAPGSGTLTKGSSVKHLTGGVTVHQDTNSDSKGFWFRLPVLRNDSDPDGDALTITSVSHVSGSMTGKQFQIGPGGQYIIVRIGEDGNTKDSNFVLKYTISDGNGGTDTAQVTVKINDDNSPLVLDLDGDGIELLPITASIRFDMGPDGQLDETGWVGQDDGLLAIDLNSDGVINDHGELFGTPATDGFTILAAYDSNGDGRIDASDEVYSDLLVWQDANSDAVSQGGELRSLADLGITGIDLNAAQTDYMIEDSRISHESTFTYADGSTGQIVDAWFQSTPAGAPEGGPNGMEASLIAVAGDGSGIYGTAGADTFLFQAIADGVDTIKDFDTESGDALDLSLLLQTSYDPLQHDINEFVFATEVDGSTVISVDADGAGEAAQQQNLAILDGVTGVDIQDMLDKGNLLA